MWWKRQMFQRRCGLKKSQFLLRFLRRRFLRNADVKKYWMENFYFQIERISKFYVSVFSARNYCSVAATTNSIHKMAEPLRYSFGNCFITNCSRHESGWTIIIKTTESTKVAAVANGYAMLIISLKRKQIYSQATVTQCEAHTEIASSHIGNLRIT